MNNTTKRLTIFIAIALLWSFLWFSQRSQFNEWFEKLPSFTILFLGLIPTLGLLIAGAFLRSRSPSITNSLTGGQLLPAVLIVSIPILCLVGIGVPNSFGVQENVFGLFIGSFTLLYALLEEYGWRGYLQEELIAKYSKWTTYIVVGLIWYLWHWFFLRPGNDPKWIMIPILIGASAGIGEISRMTKSILICAAFHGIANILFIYPIIARQLTGPEKLIVLAVCLLTWIPILRTIKANSFTPT